MGWLKKVSSSQEWRVKDLAALELFLILSRLDSLRRSTDLARLVVRGSVWGLWVLELAMVRTVDSKVGSRADGSQLFRLKSVGSSGSRYEEERLFLISLLAVLIVVKSRKNSVDGRRASISMLVELVSGGS